MDQQERLKTGTTTLGIVCKDCVILASESKTTLGSMTFAKETDKVIQIDDKIAVTTAGGGGDIQAMVRVLKAEINLYKLMRHTEITVNAVATLLSNILQGSRYYPYIAFLTIGGVDKKGVHLISSDVVGGLEEKEKYISTGSGSPFAYGVLESHYKEGMTREEGIRIAIKAVRAAMERDVFSGGKKIQVAVIDENSLKFLTKEEVEEHTQ
jgi:proteasome beta subunit